MTPYPDSQAVAIAMTLAALHDGPDRAADRELLGRYRLTGEFGIRVMRRWMLGDRPSPTTITPEEVRRILMAEPPAAQRAIDLVGRSPHLGQIVAALLDPAARIAARTQALTGVAQPELHARLRDGLGIDLDRRTIHGVAWTDTRSAPMYWRAVVVERVTDPSRQVALADAQRLDPAARLGGELDFIGALGEWKLDQPLREAGAVSINADSDDLEALRALAVPAPTRAPLAALLHSPAYRMYSEGHDVLYVEVPRAAAMALWTSLDAAAPRIAVRPIVFAGDAGEFFRARVTWRHGWHPIGGQAAKHPMGTPQAALAAVDGIDIEALLRPGSNPSDPDGGPRRGAWPTLDRAPVVALPATEDDPDREPPARRAVLLVPVDAAWKTIAYVPGLVMAGDATPSLAQVAAVARRWEERYGARIAARGPARVEWYLARRPSRREALALALELLVFAPATDDSTVEDVAAALRVDRTFTAWWD